MTLVILRPAASNSGVFEARKRTRRPSLVYCGDDAEAKEVAAALIRDVGFDPVDAGTPRSPGTLSRSRCSWRGSRTRERAAPSWRTASSGLGRSLSPRLDGTQGDRNLTTALSGAACRYLCGSRTAAQIGQWFHLAPT